jgi:hypothetical protein
VDFSANGTFAGVAVNQDGRQGTYRYANGVLITNSDQVAMQGTVTWIDAFADGRRQFTTPARELVT